MSRFSSRQLHHPSNERRESIVNEPAISHLQSKPSNIPEFERVSAPKVKPGRKPVQESIPNENALRDLEILRSAEGADGLLQQTNQTAGKNAGDSRPVTPKVGQ